MIDVVFKILGSALSIWESKESRKYIDRLIKLEKEYHAEINKDIIDDNRLDIISFELRTLGIAFNHKIASENTKNK